MAGGNKSDREFTCSVHRPTATGVSMLIPLAGEGRGWLLRTLSRSQVRKMGKIGLNQPLIYIHPIPPITPKFFAPLAKRKVFFFAMNPKRFTVQHSFEQNYHMKRNTEKSDALRFHQFAEDGLSIRGNFPVLV
jgi:hypothetical protein